MVLGNSSNSLRLVQGVSESICRWGRFWSRDSGIASEGK